MPHVAILPPPIKMGLHPARIALDDLLWPSGQPAELRGKCLRDLAPDDHLIVAPRDTIHTRPGFGTRAKISLMILEPAAIHGHHFKMLRLSHRRFHRVLTNDETLVRTLPNAVFFPFGSTWIYHPDQVDMTKTKMCSLIASSKRALEGHALRHKIAEWTGAEGHPVDLLGGGYAPFGDKSEGLAPYRYSVVIENVAERNYFTEKLIDALLCRCVPIYWGCPNIGDFLDTTGMILCQSEADIQAAIASMSQADYASRLPGLLAAEAQALHWGDVFGRAVEAVLHGRPGQIP